MTEKDFMVLWSFFHNGKVAAYLWNKRASVYFELLHASYQRAQKSNGFFLLSMYFSKSDYAVSRLKIICKALSYKQTRLDVLTLKRPVLHAKHVWVCMRAIAKNGLRVGVLHISLL